jgi:hypothetical protein
MRERDLLFWQGVPFFVEWSGVEWSGVEWSGVEWSGVEWGDRCKTLAESVLGRGSFVA